MFVTIIRRTLPDADGGWDAAGASETSFAAACGSSSTRILRSLEGRRDIFVIARWTTRDAAAGYVRKIATANPALVASQDGLELRALAEPGGTSLFHLILIQDHPPIVGEAA